MDKLRDQFAEDGPDFTSNGEEAGREPPRPALAQDERRMQVRAYNFWASLLGDRHMPAITDLPARDAPDFAPNGVLLDFTAGTDDPAIAFLGAELARECGSTDPIRTLADVPDGSLLSRITDHYMQVLANQAPIGFEADFVNQRGGTILYRGILLPFSGKGEALEHVYGVINWKEVAEPRSAGHPPQGEEEAESRGPRRSERTPLTEWADGPELSFTEDAPDLTPEQPLFGAGLDLAAREALAQRLRAVEPRPLVAASVQGGEFSVLVTRRLDSGEVVLVGEVTGDEALLQHAARALLG